MSYTTSYQTITELATGSTVTNTSNTDSQLSNAKQNLNLYIVGAAFVLIFLIVCIIVKCNKSNDDDDDSFKSDKDMENFDYEQKTPRDDG